jgi:hypothetical protein
MTGKVGGTSLSGTASVRYPLPHAEKRNRVIPDYRRAGVPSVFADPDRFELATRITMPVKDEVHGRRPPAS